MIKKELKDGESKITYRAGEQTRVLRGKIIDENENEIILQREDGKHRINKEFIIHIQEP